MDKNFTLNDYTKAIDTIAKIEKMRDEYDALKAEYNKVMDAFHIHSSGANELNKCRISLGKMEDRLTKAMKAFHRDYASFDTYYRPAQMKANYELWLEDIYTHLARNITEAFSQYMKRYCFTR